MMKYALLFLLLSFSINSQASVLNGSIVYEDGTKLLISYSGNYSPILSSGDGFLLSTTEAIWANKIEQNNMLSIKPILGTRNKGCIITSKTSMQTKRFGEISFCESVVKGKKQLNTNFIIAKNNVKAEGFVEKLLATISDEDYGVDLIIVINNESDAGNFVKSVAKIVDALEVSKESDSQIKADIQEAKKVLDNEEIKVKGYIGEGDDKQSVSTQCNGMMKFIDESSMKALVHYADKDLNFDDAGNKAIQDIVKNFNPEKHIAVAGFALQDGANIHISSDRARAIKDYLVFLGIPEDKISTNSTAIINSRVDELKDTVGIYEIDCKRAEQVSAAVPEKPAANVADSEQSDSVDKVMKCSGTLEYLHNNPPVQYLSNKNKLASYHYGESVVENSDAEKAQILELIKNLQAGESLAIMAFYDTAQNKGVALYRMLNLRKLVISSGLSKDRMEADIAAIGNDRTDLKDSAGLYKLNCKK